MTLSYRIKVAFIAFLSICAFSAKADGIDDVTALLKAGNAKEMSRYLSSNVDLTLLTDDAEYSKTQAEAALRNFFSKHSPTGIKILHKITSNPNHRFAVVNLVTNAGTFRTSISLRNFSGKFLITELRIEED